MFKKPAPEEVVASLNKDEYRLIQQLVWIYAGVHRPVPVFSNEFAVQVGIDDARAAHKSLIEKSIINESNEFVDTDLRVWLLRQIFPGQGVPPKMVVYFDKGSVPPTGDVSG